MNEREQAARAKWEDDLLFLLHYSYASDKSTGPIIHFIRQLLSAAKQETYDLLLGAVPMNSAVLKGNNPYKAELSVVHAEGWNACRDALIQAWEKKV